MKLHVLLALRNLPGGPVAGGPIAAARLLADSLNYISLPKNFSAALLVSTQILPLRLIFERRSEVFGSTMNVNLNFWKQLQNNPDSLLLNMLHHFSLQIRAKKLSRVLANFGRDGVGDGFLILHSFIPNLTYVIAKVEKTRFKIVHSEHSKGGWSREYTMMYPQRGKSRLVQRMRELEAAVAEESDVLVFPSYGAYSLFKDWHQDMVRIPREKVRIIYTGVPDWHVKFGHQPEKQKKCANLIVNIAHHVPEKRVDIFARAVHEFFKKGKKDRHFCAVNYGSVSGLVDLVAYPEVQFEGLAPHDKIIEVLRSSWVLVSVPEVAVFDLVILEAMSLGKPIIASRVGGNIEALGEDYPLYADGPAEVSDLLVELAENPDLYREVAKRNRQRYLQMFTLEAFAKRHLDLWMELCQGK